MAKTATNKKIRKTPRPFRSASGREIIGPQGTLATVVENSLNEMQPVLIVKPDDANLRAPLREWDGNVWLYAPFDEAVNADGEPIGDSQWQQRCLVERVSY
jgi:hypothetical protein